MSASHVEQTRRPRRAAQYVLAGNRYGRLVALAVEKLPGKPRKWVCQCDCGKATKVFTSHLNAGLTTSCGCYAAERMAEKNPTLVKHGMWKTREFAIWTGMLARCSENAEEKKYRCYAGRGITVCEEWKNSFATFFAYMGLRPSPAYSLERIDNDQGYRPGNVRWATAKEQLANRRNTAFVVFDGERLPIARLAERTGMDMDLLRDRAARGITGPALITPPPIRRRA